MLACQHAQFGSRRVISPLTAGTLGNAKTPRRGTVKGKGHDSHAGMSACEHGEAVVFYRLLAAVVALLAQQ